MLLEAGLKFQYEPLAITLVDEIEYPLPSYQKRGKRFGLAPTKDRKITYTPDFLGENWVIETKGYFTPVARLKWKLFKKWLIDNNLKWHLFMPTNVGQITECINIIRDI